MENTHEEKMLSGEDFINASVSDKPGSLYPPKPVPEDVPQKNQTLKFVASLILFGGFYYFFVSKDLEIITWLAIIVFIHELGHYFAMKIFKYEDLSIFFLPLIGAIAGGSKEKISQKEKTIVLLAGPVPGIIIGVVLYLIAIHQGSYLTLRLSYAFVLINALNLLPVYPLDGGQLLKTLFLGSRQVVATIFVVISIIVLILFALKHSEWFLLVIPYFLIRRMIQERQTNHVRKELDHQQLNYHKTFGELTDEEYWKIREVALYRNSELSKNVVTEDYVIAENENEVIAYVKSLLKTKPLRDLSALAIGLFLLIWTASVVVPILLMTRVMELL